MTDLDLESEMYEMGLLIDCERFRDRAAEIPMARRFNLETVDRAIQALQDAKLSIRQAHQKVAA
jgi:hypothetical protein